MVEKCEVPPVPHGEVGHFSDEEILAGLLRKGGRYETHTNFYCICARRPLFPSRPASRYKDVMEVSS